MEAEIIARPGERFLFQASVGYLDGKYRQYLDGGVDVAANRSFPSAPKFTVSTSVDWTAIDSDRAKLNLIADLRTVSKYYLYAAPFTATATQDPAALSRTPDRTVLDLRAVFSQFAIGPGKASLSFWGKNVLNDKSANYFIPFGPAFLNLVTANYNDPRTYGVTLGLRY